MLWVLRHEKLRIKDTVVSKKELRVKYNNKTNIGELKRLHD